MRRSTSSWACSCNGYTTSGSYVSQVLACLPFSSAHKGPPENGGLAGNLLAKPSNFWMKYDCMWQGPVNPEIRPLAVVRAVGKTGLSIRQSGLGFLWDVHNYRGPIRVLFVSDLRISTHSVPLQGIPFSIHAAKVGLHRPINYIALPFLPGQLYSFILTKRISVEKCLPNEIFTAP